MTPSPGLSQKTSEPDCACFKSEEEVWNDPQVAKRTGDKHSTRLSISHFNSSSLIKVITVQRKLS